jgi:hypothetical protein
MMAATMATFIRIGKLLLLLLLLPPTSLSALS